MTAEFTKTPNQLLDVLMPLLSGSEFKIVMFTIRKTLGYHKTSDRISVSQYMEGTGLTKPTVVKALNELQRLNILRLIQQATRKGTEWMINITQDVIEAVKNRTSKSSTQPKPVVKKFNHSEEEKTPDETSEAVKIFYQLWLKNLTSKWLKNLTHKRKEKENIKEKNKKNTVINHNLPDIKEIDPSLSMDEFLEQHNRQVTDIANYFLERMAKTR